MAFVRKLRLAQKGLLVLAVPLLLQLGFFWALASLLHQSDYELNRQAALNAIILDSTRLNSKIYEATIALGIYSIGKSPVLGQQQFALESEIEACTERLLSSLRSFGTEAQKRMSVMTHAQNALTRLRSSRQSFDDTPKPTEFELRSLFKATQHDADALQEEIDAIVGQSGSHEHDRTAVTALVAAGAVFSVCLTSILAILFTREIVARLSVIQQNSFKLAAGKPLSERLRGADEIASLDETFHLMSEALSDSAARERAIITYAVDVICSLDENGRFLSVSPACLQLWGFEEVDLLGRSCVALCSLHDASALLDKLKNAMCSASVFSFQAKMVRKDGSIIDCLWSGCWSQREKQLFCIVHDISEEKRLESLKEQFVAMVSHDLRTPLSSVKFFLSLLAEDQYPNLPTTVKETAHSSEKDIGRLIQMVNALLEIAKLDSGKMSFASAPMSMRDVAKRSMDSISGFAREQGVAIALEGEEDATVYGDAERLVRALVNLLSNAVQFSPERGTVLVRIEPNFDHCVISVSDQGPGIPEECAQKIFDRFEQIQSGTTRSKGGAGLGLAICKAIVDEHKGSIGVENRNGTGSRFWIKLPVHDSERIS